MRRVPVISIIFLLLGLGACKRHDVSGNKVYYIEWDEASGKKKKLIPGADKNSFEELDHPRYAKDKLHVYFECDTLPAADPATFESIMDFYGKDAKHVWKGAKMVNGADPATFELVDGASFSKDRKDYYFDTIALHVPDLNSFTVLQGSWAKDDRYYYIGGHRHALADCNSFEVLAGGYAKDRMHVYFLDSIVAGADAPSFKVHDYGLAEDRNGSYEGWKKVR